jgi:hypothetical protein
MEVFVRHSFSVVSSGLAPEFALTGGSPLRGSPPANTFEFLQDSMF